MAACAYCGTTILFGGKRAGERRFCNDECEQNDIVAGIAEDVPDDVVTKQVWQVHQGLCPKCGGNGPVDVHTSYRVWSALVMTSWKSRTHVVCRPCGSKARIADAAFCVAFGWWGFPWGIIMTPIQIFRNVAGIFRTSDPTTPSAQLELIVRTEIAAKAVHASVRREA